MSRQNLLTTVQQLQMVDALVELGKWPRGKADYVVRQVSTHLSSLEFGSDLNALLAELKAQKIITVLQSLQVRQYLTTLDLKRELRPDLRAPPQNVYLVSNICTSEIRKKQALSPQQ
jgi:hypothetical protein